MQVGYVYAGGQLIAEYKNSTTYFVHDNNLGSSTILTSLAGAVVDCNAMYPYGEQDTTICTTSNSIWDKFTGYRLDPETGLEYDHARYYNPSLGRFMSADPFAGNVGNPQSMNRYPYVVNNPLRFTDPTGMLLCGMCFDPDDIRFGLFSPYGDFGLPLMQFLSRNFQRTWSQTFNCNMSATQVMSAVQNDMGQFADHLQPGDFSPSIFPDQPITMGGQYSIQVGVGLSIANMYTPEVFTGMLPAKNLAVTVTSESANSWTFTTDPSHHYFDGTVSFSFTDAGNGNITFSITADANWANPITHYTIGPLIWAGENGTWSNVLHNVQSFCQTSPGK
jgi:RHS repeat-associated protein